jgi:hypothetical protein
VGKKLIYSISSRRITMRGINNKLKTYLVMGLIFAAGLFSAPANAVEASDLLPAVVGLHLVSHHLNERRNGPNDLGWNDRNYGVYARWSNGLTVGTFRNSMYRRSNYVAWTWEGLDSHVALTVGAATGYDRVTSGKGDRTVVRCSRGECRDVNVKDIIAPLVVPSVRMGLGAIGLTNTSARLSLLKSPGAPAALNLSVEHRF